MKISMVNILITLLTILTVGCSDQYEVKKPSKEGLYNSMEMLKKDGDIRVMQYNIHFGVGTDEKYDIDRIVKAIKEINADIIVLNEVDKHYSSRSNWMDMAKYIAEQLGMNYVYDSSIRNEPTSASGGRLREVGNAVITKYDIRFVETKFFSEGDTWPRVISKSVVTLPDGRKLNVAMTHFGLIESIRLTQAKEAMEFLEEESKGALLLCGDLNAIPTSAEVKYISARMKDAFIGKPTAYTFSSMTPSSRIDYIFGSDAIIFRGNAATIRNTLASDHLPIFTDFTF